MYMGSHSPAILYRYHRHAVVPRAQAKVTMAPVAVDHSLISELVLGSSYLAGQIQLRLLSWLLQQFVAADSMAGPMVRWSCSRNGVLLQEQPCLCPLELQDCPDHSDCPVHSSKSLIWQLIHVWSSTRVPWPDSNQLFLPL